VVDPGVPHDPPADVGAGVVPDPEALVPATMLVELDGLSTAELRERREACERAEEGVSYARRLLQGRLDLLRAELARRDDPAAASALDALPTVLASDQAPSDPSQARAVRLRIPADADAYEAVIDRIIAEAEVGEHEVGELAYVIEHVAAFEHELSGVRRALFDRIDALRDELAARYKDGRADVSELLR